MMGGRDEGGTRAGRGRGGFSTHHHSGLFCEKPARCDSVALVSSARCAWRRGRRRSVMRHIRLDTLFHAGDDIPWAVPPTPALARPRSGAIMAPPAGACGGFCCVAKRFDRPFRLPRDAARRDADAAAGVAEGGVASSAGSPSGRPPSEPDADAGGLAAAASTSRARASEGESPGAEGPPDDSDEDETPEEEATARARLAEILRAIDDEGDAGGGTSSSSGALAHGSPSARAHLSPLAHLSHRRERHCRVILQHPAASRVARLLAAVLEDDAPENADDRAPRILLAHNLPRRGAARAARGGETDDYSTYEHSDEEEEAAAGVRDDAEFDGVDGSDAVRRDETETSRREENKPSEYDVPGEEAPRRRCSPSSTTTRGRASSAASSRW